MNKLSCFKQDLKTRINNKVQEDRTEASWLLWKYLATSCGLFEYLVGHFCQLATATPEKNTLLLRQYEMQQRLMSQTPGVVKV